MAIAISEEHSELAKAARSFLAGHDARGANRALLDTAETGLPAFWKEFADLGLLGIHVPEEFGGGGAGLAESVVVAEELGRAVAPGPAVPTMAASAVITLAGGPELTARLLPALAGGTAVGALGLGGSAALTLDNGLLTGRSGVVLGGALADHVLLVVGEDVAVVATAAPGVTVETPPSLDRARNSARLVLDEVAIGSADLLTGAGPLAVAVARTLFAAEATGGAHECVTASTAYAKVREQFGRTIGSFQAVKHHLANMLVDAELATAATWDAGRAAAGPSGTAGQATQAAQAAQVAQFELAAAAAAALAIPAFVSNAELNIQIHGGIGFTWEHDAHLLQRRALTLRAVLPAVAAATDVTRLGAAGVERAAVVNLPADVEAARDEVRATVRSIAELAPAEQRARLVETGYLQPHWPKPWGLEASAGLQLLIEEELAAAGVRRPDLSITGWVILTLIQHGTPEQVERWVPPALAGGTIWCQLFSEPSAGSDAAAVRTSGVRVDGGWLVTGQKLWTSDAHRSRHGLATVRTDPAASKHAGITMMVVDMAAPGVEIRPLRQTTGDSGFNEVFFTDVFVPDADVVGEPGKGWTVARATLGNERVSLGGTAGGVAPADLIQLGQEHGHRIAAPEARIGAHIAVGLALRLLNLRRAERAVAGSGPGPEGNVTKLVLAEHGQRTATLLAELVGEDIAFSEGYGGLIGRGLLATRALTIAGGTSEISRNQIAERILGLPREQVAN